jgi:hypothetical protein
MSDVKKECKFAIHIPTNHPDKPDIHLIKEVIHYPDGTTKPSLRFIKDYQRPFYLTKPGYRNHKDKKEFEDLDKLQCFTSTQSQLRYNLAKALNKNWSKESLKELSASPYVYGTDISSTTFIKRQYELENPDTKSAYSVATFDVETDVVNGTNQIIMASTVFENQIVIGICNHFVAGLADPILQINQKIKQYLADYVAKLNLEVTIHLVDQPYDAVLACFNYIHKWMPDFLAIWNMDFDIPKILDACDQAGVSPKHLFSDPSVPKPYRYFKYNQGKKKKVTASGKVMPIPPSSQWHVVECPSSFFVIDAMCVYRILRLAKPEEPSYSLDAILNKELKISKLKFKEADQHKGLKWHQFMQTSYKLEYVVYNIFDSLSMIELDNKTLDLKFTLPTFAGVSDFANFKSQPKKISDALYFFLLERNKVLAAVGRLKDAIPEDVELADDHIDNEKEDDSDLSTLGLKGWIVTLPAMLIADNGLRCITEDDDMVTNIRAYTFDNDTVSAYPSCILACNISKETTSREIISINGIEEEVFKMQNINCLSGKTNSLEYCVNMFNFPKPEQLLDLYLKQKNT